MEHWFTEWLLQQAENETEEKSSLYKRWAQMAGDMIPLGLEDVVLRYYDVKQQGTDLLPRPQKITEWKFDGILLHLERKLDMAYETEEKEQLQEVYTTLTELLKTGMHQTAVTYYLRCIMMYPTLRLKKPIMSVSEA